MKSRTLFQCWFLLITVLAFSFICEFMIKSFQEDGKVYLHRIAPITALPVILKEVNREKIEAKKKKNLTVKYAQAVLYNGKSIEGAIIEESDTWLTLKVDGSQVGLAKSDIKEFRLIPVPAKN